MSEEAAAARRRRVDEHLGLVRAIAVKVRRQISTRLELDDLVAYGTQGLLEASERFDDRYQVTFATYAYHRIKGAIYDGLRKMAQLPRGEYLRVRQAEAANEYLGSLKEREIGAAAQEGAPARPSTEDDLRAMYQAMAGVVTTFVTSLDAAVQKGLEIPSEGPATDDAAALSQLGGRVRAAIDRLPEKERHFIRKHYFEGKTLQEAGDELGLSKSWASRLHARAVDLLRAEIATDPKPT